MMSKHDGSGMFRICRISLRLCAILCLTLSVTNCKMPSSGGNGSATLPLHHYNWWNYYLRGVQYLNRDEPERALVDFEMCLGIQRGARSISQEDSWRERTYGLHVLENYFPNRELGVCFYEMGDLEQASECLERSLGQTPSGRAKYYLNLVRQAQLVEEDSPLTSPVIMLDASSQQLWTRKHNRIIAGEAAAEGYIAHISVAGEPEFVELAKSKRSFRRTIPMEEGDNYIAVTVNDLLGNKAETNVLWKADWTPPGIAVRTLTQHGNDWRIQGICYDNMGLMSLSVNGEEILLPDKTGTSVMEQTFDHVFSADAGLMITARDMAGNNMDFYLDDMLIREACLKTGRMVHLVSAADALPGVRSERSMSDSMKPVIRLMDDYRVYSIYKDSFYLDGEVIDRGGLVSLLVNGEEWLKENLNGVEIWRFAGYLPVEVGTNQFDIVAEDKAGNQTEQAITVIRRIPDYLNENYRLRAAMTPLTSSIAPDWLSIKTVDQYLSLALLRTPQRFKILTRGDDWDRILDEVELSASDLADPHALLRLKQYLPAEYLFSGVVFDERDGATIFVKVLDVEAQQSIFETDVYIPEGSRNTRFETAGLISKIEQFFPVLEAGIKDIKGATINLDVGRDHGVRKGSRFMVLCVPENGSLDEGHVLFYEKDLVQVEAEKVYNTSSVGGVTPRNAKGSVSLNDRLYTR